MLGPQGVTPRRHFTQCSNMSVLWTACTSSEEGMCRPNFRGDAEDVMNASSLGIHRTGRTTHEVLGIPRNFGLSTKLDSLLLQHNCKYLEDFPYASDTLQYQYQLIFWSILLKFQLCLRIRPNRPPSDQFHPNSHEIEIRGKDGRICGLLFGGCADNFILAGLLSGIKVMCDFIIIPSVGRCDEEGGDGYEADSGEMIDCLNIMAVNWKDGIAERIGIGNIFSHALDRDSFDPGPQWREVILG
jgi:hypothetical protein